MQWTLFRALGLVCFVLLAIAGCDPTPAPSEQTELDATSADVVSDDQRPGADEATPLIGYLWIVEGGKGDAFCSATRIGARHVVSVAHCGETIVDGTGSLRKDIEVFWGTALAARSEATARRVRISAAQLLKPPKDVSQHEGIVLLTLASDAGWSKGTIVTLLDPAFPPTKERGLKASGYGFGCDNVHDPNCCDPRYEKGCATLPWGTQKQQRLTLVSVGPWGLYTLLSPGELLCAGDSGVGLRADTAPGELAIAAVYTGSFLVEPKAFAGVPLKGTRICIPFAMPASEDAKDQQGFYVNQFVRLCPYAEKLGKAIPNLKSRCQRDVACQTAATPAGWNTPQAWKKLEAAIAARRDCE